MPFYSKSAFPHSILRMGNNPWPNYLFGSFDTKTQPMLFKITHVALATNVATVTVSLISGGGPGFVLPVVGQVIGIAGTTSTGGTFNVDPATITATTVDTTGTGTISYSVTHADITGAADVGQLVALPFESFDIVAAGSTSIPVALTSTPDETDNSRSLFAEAVWTGTLPTAATVVLEVANVDKDSRYYVVENAQGVAVGGVVAASDALATIAGSAVTQAGAEYSFIMGKFVRAKVLSMTGGDGTTGLLVTLAG